MICFKGDEVKLKSGQVAEVIDTWGIARNWYKLKSHDGTIVYAMTGNIESIVKRHSNKNGKGRSSK